MDVCNLSYLFKENASIVLILVGLSLYLVALLNMTAMGSTTFVICSYAGTVLSLSGIMMKIGIIQTALRSIKGLSVVMLFTSALLFTTAIVVPFVAVSITPWVRDQVETDILTHVRDARLNTRFRPNWGGGNINCILQVHRPYLWLLQPLVLAGSILLVSAAIIQCLRIILH